MTGTTNVSERGNDIGEGAGPRLVILAPTGRDQELIVRLLREQGLDCEGSTSEEQLLDVVGRGLGPVVVAEEALSTGGIDRLGRLLDEQPNWSDLPVIVLTRANGQSERRMQSLVRRRGVHWLRRPQDAQSLAALARTAVEARRRQEEVRDLLAEQRRLNKRLAHRARQLQRMAIELTEAEDRERQRLARLLHDDLQQLLVGANLHLSMASKQVEDEDSLGPALKQVGELITQAQEKSRHLSHELFPSALRKSDLTEVVQWLAENSPGLEVNVRVKPDLPAISARHLRFLYRAAREVLCNVAKHAGVTEAELTAGPNGRWIEVVVSDRGAGFDPATLEQAEVVDGLGLLSIRERIEALGGRLEIDSRAGEGSRFTFLMPADNRAHAAEQAEEQNPPAIEVTRRTQSSESMK